MEIYLFRPISNVGLSRFLHYIHSAVDENMASIANISRQIRTQSETNW